MEEINAYRTVRTTGFTQLDEEVNSLIKEGFQPFGSPYTAVGKDGFRVCQAMVKFGEKDRRTVGFGSP